MRGFFRNRLWDGLIYLIAALVYAVPVFAQESVTALDPPVHAPLVLAPGTPSSPVEALTPLTDPVPQEPVTAPTGTTAPKPDRDLNSMSIEELMELEVQTVVSASRYRQKVSDAPASVTIITSEDIRKYGYRTLADILRSVRGFYTTYDRNYDYIGVRGFGRLGDRNTRILLLVDGHRLNDAIFDSAPIGTEFPLDVDLIESVEVTRGPGSSLYGNNAFFGVVNITTRRAKDIGGELSAEAAENSTYKGRLSYGTAGKNDGAFLASASGFTSDGGRLYFREFDPQNPLSDPRAANGGHADNGDYDRFRSAYAKYDQGGLRLAAAYIERTKGIPTASHGADFDNPGNRTVDERGYIDLQYSTRSDQGNEYTARVYYDQYWFDADHLYTGTVNKTRDAATWYGGEARMTTRLWNAHHVIAGVEYEDRERQDQWNGDEGPSPVLFLDDQRSSRAWAAYVQDEIRVSPCFLLYAGIRRDQVSTFGGSTDPRLAAVLTPVEHGTLKLLYGRAFRAPTVYEMFYQAPPATLSNPALQPETIDTYELAYEHDFGKRLYASVSQYTYRIKNLITQTYDATSGTTSFQNQEKAEATGTELEVRKTWENGADGRISYTYQRAEDPNTGELLTNSPQHLAKLNVDVPLSRERLWAGLEEQYTGPRFTQAGRKTQGAAVTNLTLLGRNRSRTLEISLSIYNLLDKRYADPVSIDLSPLDTVQQDGRTVRAKVTYAF